MSAVTNDAWNRAQSYVLNEGEEKPYREVQSRLTVRNQAMSIIYFSRSFQEILRRLKGNYWHYFRKEYNGL